MTRKTTKAERIVRFVAERPRRFIEIQRYAHHLAHPGDEAEFDRKALEPTWRSSRGEAVPERRRALRGYYCDGARALARAGWIRKREDGLWEWTGQELVGPWYRPRLSWEQELLARRDLETLARHRELKKLIEEDEEDA